MATDSNGRSESALQDLAERIEAADGPDRDIDGVIDRLFNDRPKHGDFDASEGAFWKVENGYSGLLERPDGFARGSFCAPRYTASLDAAMTLVPEGMDWILVDQRATYGTPFVRVKSGDDRVADWEGRAPTPALALCAAALKARHSQGSSL